MRPYIFILSVHVEKPQKKNLLKNERNFLIEILILVKNESSPYKKKCSNKDNKVERGWEKFFPF
jgi:hypothetical protein